MQLIFTHLFRPKWQHPKPGVRRQAVSQLKPESESDQSILQGLARDDDSAEVRLQAVQKLANPSLLLSLSSQDPDPAVRVLAGNRLCDLITTDAALSLTEREALLQTIEDPQLLTRICLGASEPQLQQGAAARITEEAVLEQLLLQSDNHSVRQQAATRIETPERLTRLSKLIRQKDKGVYRILKERLDSDKARQQAAQAAEEVRERLQEQLGKLARGTVVNGDQARLDHLQSQWQALPSAPAVALQRFTEALEQCQARLDQHQEAEAAQQAAISREQERQRLLQAWSRQLRTAETVDGGAAALAEQLQLLAQGWRLLLSDAPDAQCQQYSQLQSDSQTLLDALGRWEQHQPLLAEATDAPGLTPLLEAIAWPAPFPAPGELQTLRARLEKAKAAPRTAPKAAPEADPAQARQLTEALEQLEQAVEQGQFQEASRLHKRLKSLRDGQPRLLRGEQRARYQQVNARYLELNSWQQFATRPKAEALCEAMETLVGAELTSSQRAEQLRALQRQWKLLESPTLPNALRTRFQQANDRVYSGCRDHFEQQRLLRAENLQRREALCQQLNELQQLADGENPDLKPLVQQLRELKQQWRQSSPVERTLGKALQRRYQGQLQTLEARLDALRAQSGEAKTGLIAQAQAWQAAAAPVSEAQVRQLQQQWRQLAPTHHRQEQALWTEFTTLCQQLNTRREQAGRQDREAAREQAQTLCQQLETTTEPLGQSLTTLQGRFQAALQTLGDQSALAARFERACLNYQLRVSDDTDTLPLIERRQLLCESLEAAITGDGEAADIPALQAAWGQGEHPPAPYAELLGERFSQALSLQDDRESLADTLEQATRSLRLLCVRLEIACGRSSPDEDQALRLEYQMTRLQDALNEHQQPLRPCADEVRDLQYRWRCVPFSQHQGQLAQRFQHTLDHLLG